MHGPHRGRQQRPLQRRPILRRGHSLAHLSIRSSQPPTLLTQVLRALIERAGCAPERPFELELITLTHSIPEPNAVVIRTPLGAVLHTGDWKLDPDPVVGPTTDEEALRRLGDEGVLAMVCDSTNALRPGESGSVTST